MSDFQPHVSRRAWLQQSACGFGYLALAGLTARQALGETLPTTAQPAMVNPLAAKPPHFAPRAKRIIFIFMQGGPSQVDTFDYKPRLQKEDGKQVSFHNSRTRVVSPERVYGSPWKFQQYGECGQWVSELFPHMARHVDDVCFIKGMHTEGVAHGPATIFLHTGTLTLERPSMGAWISYGLGTENDNLPAFVTINPTLSKGGPRNWGNSFLPTIHQGTTVGRAGSPSSEARIRYITNDRLGTAAQRQQLDFLQSLNQEQLHGNPQDDALNATINSYELAWRMQNHAPGILDIADESAATLKAYGLENEATADFGRQCLMARRLAEADVRYIQINYSDNSPTPRWDQHSNLKKHEEHALATDQPVAALLADLKQRGLLEDTLVWWGGEFGRTPFSQGKDGRDHNPAGFTVWLAGGGVKAGFSYGETDEYGAVATVDKVHMHDLHATLLHLMGLDHERLTFRQAGRDFRLTDVHGRLVRDIIA